MEVKRLAIAGFLDKRGPADIASLRFDTVALALRELLELDVRAGASLIVCCSLYTLPFRHRQS